MFGRRLTPSLATLRFPTLLGALFAALLLPACVVEPTDEDAPDVEAIQEGTGDLEGVDPAEPAPGEVESPADEGGEPQPTPWHQRVDESDDGPAPPDGCSVDVSGTGTAKDDE